MIWIVDFLRSGKAPTPLATVQRLDVIDGGTYQIVPSSSNTTLVINEGPDVNTLTILFPPDDISRVGQIVRLASLISVSSLTLAGTNIMNTVEQLQPNDCVGYQKIEETGWVRIV